MRLIIDIPEEMWELVKEGYFPLGISKCLKNGIPLPKGHGKLKDVSKIYNHIDALNHGKDKGKFTGVLAVINMAETIIEADKTESDEGRYETVREAPYDEHIVPTECPLIDEDEDVCEKCLYAGETDGSHCYECVKGESKFKAESEE